MSELIPAEYIDLIVKGSYFLAAFLFIFGLIQMSSPVTARGGIVWAGAGMVLRERLMLICTCLDGNQSCRGG